MNKIVHETWLTKLVDQFGDIALKGVMDSVYRSGLFKFTLTVFVTLAFISLGVGIHRRQISPKIIFSALAFLLIYPVSGKPSAYVTIDSIGRATRYVFEKGINKVISGSDVHIDRANMPPGIVLEMIVNAATAKIEDPVSRSLIHGFVVNCLPNALRKDGDHATFEDLFHYETTYKVEQATGKSVVNYIDRIVDIRSLKNDNSYARFRPGKRCDDGLYEMRHALADTHQDDALVVDRVVHRGSNGKVETTEKWFKNWRASGSKFRNLAHNLATARAATYEKSKIIEEVGTSPGSRWFERTGTDASIRELMASYGSLPSFGYHLSDLKDIMSNTSGSRWSFSLGASLKDLKERIELLPYNLAAILLLLKFILPFVLLTLFLQTFRFLFIWAGAWITALLIPSIISASRSVGNSILLSKLGIENLVETDGYKALAHGVDLSVAANFLDDFIPLGYALINQELTIISVLSGCMIVGGWLAGGGTNGFVSWMSNSVQGTLTGGATSAAAGKMLAGAKTVSEKVVLPVNGPRELVLSSMVLSYGAARAVMSHEIG
ncbi:MAG: hypothetical protein H6618_08860 [Deltaproteobacteria bacterium]|nr:hypothetical protein [Deltaproteobacteria bacterium]